MTTQENVYSKKSCFDCVEKSVKKRSKCCKNISEFDFLLAYLFSNKHRDEFNGKIIIDPSVEKQNKKILKCAIAISKYKKRLLVCGAKYSYRQQRIFRRIKKLYDNSRTNESKNTS